MSKIEFLDPLEAKKLKKQRWKSAELKLKDNPNTLCNLAVGWPLSKTALGGKKCEASLGLVFRIQVIFSYSSKSTEEFSIRLAFLGTQNLIGWPAEDSSFVGGFLK